MMNEISREDLRKSHDFFEGATESALGLVLAEFTGMTFTCP